MSYVHKVCLFIFQSQNLSKFHLRKITEYNVLSFLKSEILINNIPRVGIGNELFEYNMRLGLRIQRQGPDTTGWDV